MLYYAFAAIQAAVNGDMYVHNMYLYMYVM